MTDEEILDVLRRESSSKSPTQLALLFDEITDGGLSYSSLIGCFSVAFPKVPLQVLIGLGKWKRVGGMRWSDDDVNRVLEDWFPYDQEFGG